MGQVYRAIDTRLRRQVAIKILPASVVADHERLARFQREAEVLASLNHPHIAAIYGFEESSISGSRRPNRPGPRRHGEGRKAYMKAMLHFVRRCGVAPSASRMSSIGRDKCSRLGTSRTAVSSAGSISCSMRTTQRSSSLHSRRLVIANRPGRVNGERGTRLRFEC